MTRRCSHCSNNGHNSRTCPTRGGAGGGGGVGSAGGGGGGGVRLFGVRLTDGSFMKKSASMGSLSLYHHNATTSSAAVSSNPTSPSSDPMRDTVRVQDGYLSDDPNRASCSSNRRCDRKKGKPWTEEEHRRFLIGLQKLGKGDWRGIARNYVVSRTPTQVASHAQKYFIRQTNATRRKRRSSLFDMVTEEPEIVTEELFLSPPAPEETEMEYNNNNSNPMPSLNLSLSSEAEPMEEAASKHEPEETMVLPSNLAPTTTTIPTFFLSIPYPQFWPQSSTGGEASHHQVLKPTPVFGKEPFNVDELVGMSRLHLSEIENSYVVPPQLSLNILRAPSRQSAFHAT